MVDPTTANTSMSVPIRGTDVGTWDTPVNGNFNILDSMFGSVASIALSSTPVTLTTSQAQCSIIRLTGTLLSNVAITMASINKFWTIDNQIVNSPSSFCVTMVSTSGASVIGCPPGTTDVFYDGTNMNYKNMGKFGEYWDYAGSTVPSWVTSSTKPPWLNCDGTAFSSATYPILANLLGTTTLPDSKGRTRSALNQGSSRLLSSIGGVDGNTNYAGGGTDGVILVSSQIPTITSSGTASGISGGGLRIPVATAGEADLSFSATGSGIHVPQATGWTFSNNLSGSASVTSQNTGGATPTQHANVQPTYVGGITMIRAA